MSAIYGGVIARALDRLAAGVARDPGGAWRVGWRPPRPAWALFRSMLAVAGGRGAVRRAWEPA